MLTSIISISILVLTALVIRAWDKRSRSTNSPSEYKLTPSDEHELTHWREAQIYRAAEKCEQRKSGRALGGDITVYYDDDMLDNRLDVALYVKYLQKFGKNNGVHLERR